ncbi:porin [Variovorax sp. UC122_21]|uniref:porin n=1 Tax=Variovorax sp. UC122_21 TaxID=3374554 RepID=UPI003758466F
MFRHPTLALGLAATACGAAAQSSLTVFGIVDAAVSHYSTRSVVPDGRPSFLLPPGSRSSLRSSQTVLSSGSSLPSRIGFRGTEDLGGGLAASFWLESPLANDNGAVGLGTFARRSTVSLSGGFGEIRLGRDYTPTFWNDTLFDPFSNIGVGGNLIGSVNTRLAVATARATGDPLNGGLPGGPDNYVRTANAIGYFLPAGLNGLYGQVQYALHENVKRDEEVGSPSRRGAEAGLRLGYAAGALDVAGTFVQSTVGDAWLPGGVHGTRKVRSASLGASYDVGGAKLFGEVSRVADEARSAFAANGFQVPTSITGIYQGALLGITVPLGAGQIRAAYSRVKFENDARPFVPVGTAAGEASAAKLALGYSHSLSRRTTLYATVARIRIREGQNNPAVMGAGVGPAGTGTFATSGVFSPRSAIGYDFGVRHVF